MKPGKIASIQGKQEIAEAKYVKNCFYSYDTGDELPQEAWGRLAQIFLRIQITGGEKGYSEVVDIMKKHLAVSDPSGGDLLLNKEIVIN